MALQLILRNLLHLPSSRCDSNRAGVPTTMSTNESSASRSVRWSATASMKADHALIGVKGFSNDMGSVPYATFCARDGDGAYGCLVRQLLDHALRMFSERQNAGLSR